MNRIMLWRQKSGFSCLEVDKKLGFEAQTTQKYEYKGFVKVPCCDLYKMAKLYEISDFHFQEAVFLETKGLKPIEQ